MNQLAKVQQRLIQEPTVKKGIDWYQSLPSRDQLILKMVSALLIMVVVATSFIVPIFDRTNELQSSLDKQLKLYNQMAANSYRFSNNGVSITSDRPVLSEVTRYARTNKITLSRYEQQGTDLRTWFDDVNFDKSIRMLDQLSAMGIVAKQINIDRGSRPGLVDMRATLGR